MPALPWKSVNTPPPAGEFVVMASRFELRRYRDLPRFVRLTWKITRQLRRTPALVGYSLDAQPLRRTFWTLSTWESGSELGRFNRTAPHSVAAGQLRERMKEATFVTWSVAADDPTPTWAEARQRIAQSQARR